MLQDIRDNAQGTIAKVIVGLIVITFALFGVESIVGGLGGEPEVATVNGEEITEVEFNRAVELDRRQILSRMGENADPNLIDEQGLKKRVLERLIEEAVLLQYADERNMDISDVQIKAEIQKMPDFQVDGKFSNERFLSAIRSLGMTTNDFVLWLKKRFLLAQQNSSIVQSSFYTQSELQQILNIDRQSRDVALVLIKADEAGDLVEVTDSEINAFYEENKERYKTPEQLSIDYVLLDRNALLDEIQISDEELQTRFQESRDSMVKSEERKSSHILIEVSDNRDESEAEKVAQDVKSQLDDGASFESLVEQYSDDLGSKSDAGNLGFAKRGDLVPEYEDVLFSMSSPGMISSPVKSEYGYHIIRLDEVGEASLPEFEEVAEQLTLSLKLEKIDKVYAEKSEKLADISYAAANLDEPSKELAIPVQKATLTRSNNEVPEFDHPKLINSAFSKEVLEEGYNSKLIELSKDKAVVIHVNQHQPESYQSLEEIRPEIEADLKVAKRAKYVLEKGRTLVKALSEGQSLQAVEGYTELSWDVKSDVQRNSVALPPVVVEKLFALKQPAEGSSTFGGIQLKNGDFYAIRIDAINSTAADVSETDKSQLARLLGQQLGNQDFELLKEIMVNTAEIEKI
ncbi:parvulin-like peptidyl-prolyl isomerase [Oleiphilus messinensis]|uniref:Periplasmic chaperone PpiD n=1 Tax=Oleiphilus messinensis TaxID=141451 RepID=A0A1Y0I7Y1_9GAMM|nr:SurA N-terminal domain-containing protein [Oleiphilus messinensis]ARU56309.1 parvulin-like peptidyl-prolyl isomerase [Oleiphilus messinensis]